MSARTLLPVVGSALFTAVKLMLDTLDTCSKVRRAIRVLVLPLTSCILTLVYPYTWLINQCRRIADERLVTYANLVYADQLASPAGKNLRLTGAALEEGVRVFGLAVVLFIVITAINLNISARASRRFAWFNIHKTNKVIKVTNWMAWAGALIASFIFLVVIQAV